MSGENSITRFLGNQSKPSNDPQEIVKEVVKEMERTKDLQIGIEFIRLVHNIVSTLDGTLDAIIQPMERLYEEENAKKEYGGMSFYDMMTRMTPLSRETIHRHSRFKKIQDRVPEEFRPRIEILGRKEKNQLLSIVEDGYEINAGQWDRIASANSYQDVAEVVREVKGVEPRSQWCQFRVDEDGVVWAHTDIGAFPCIEPKKFENAEIQAKMTWVYEKITRKLGATPR